MDFTTVENIDSMTHQEVLNLRAKLTAHTAKIGYCPAELRGLSEALDTRILLDLLAEMES